METFVVFEEGGVICPLPFKGWLSAIRCGAPIIGVQIANRRFVYDRILRRYGHSGFRAA